MHYLIATILASTLFGLGLKLSETGGRDRLVVAFANYLAGTLSLLLWWLSPWAAGVPTLSAGTAAVGLLAGLTWVAGLLTMMVSTGRCGIALTTAISRLSLVFVVLACALVWHDPVDGREGAGIALALTAVFLLGIPASRRGGRVDGRGALLLVALLLAQFGAQISLKIFKVSCPPGEVLSFMFITFLAASLITGAVLLRRRQSLRRGDLIFGAGIGLLNLLTGVFMTQALLAMQSTRVYTVANVATISLLAISGLAWGEKPGRPGIIGLVLTLLSLILLGR